ncbi:Fur family transcriptional regulator [Companilactobacillus metriopterae]|nr:Fur family transcriptional regulator [Companilactobacillus metriopterae]
MIDQKISEDTLEVLKKNHLRVTPQRHTILAYLASQNNHPTVDMIHEGLKKEMPNIGSSTIYNTLNTLVEHHVVIEIQNGDGFTHYDYFGVPHLHAVCSNCGKIFDVNYDGFGKDQKRIEDKVKEETGFQISNTQIEVTGICADCQKLV